MGIVQMLTGLGHPVVSLGSLFQCLTTLLVKKCFLISVYMASLIFIPSLSLQDSYLDPSRAIVRTFQQVNNGDEHFKPVLPKATEYAVLKPSLGPSLIHLKILQHCQGL